MALTQETVPQRIKANLTAALQSLYGGKGRDWLALALLVTSEWYVMNPSSELTRVSQGDEELWTHVRIFRDLQVMTPNSKCVLSLCLEVSVVYKDNTVGQHSESQP